MVKEVQCKIHDGRPCYKLTDLARYCAVKNMDYILRTAKITPVKVPHGRTYMRYLELDDIAQLFHFCSEHQDSYAFRTCGEKLGKWLEDLGSWVPYPVEPEVVEAEIVPTQSIVPAQPGAVAPVVENPALDTMRQFVSQEFGLVRIVIIDNEPWFVLQDVCKAIEVGSPHKVADRLDDDEKGRSFIPTLGGHQEMVIINESGLYTVILRSNKPQAKPFRKWVTSEVLPSIRKHGMYAAEDLIKNPEFGLMVFQDLCEKRKRVEELQEANKALQQVNDSLQTVNQGLTKDTSTWDKRPVLVALLRGLSSRAHCGDFKYVWTKFY
jgi:prophage antirepressor-like protein